MVKDNLLPCQHQHQNYKERWFKWLCMTVGVRANLSISENANLRMTRLLRAHSKARVTPQLLCYCNHSLQMQESVSECARYWTLKQMGYSSKRSHSVSLLSEKNRKPRLELTQAHQNYTTEDWLPGLMSLNLSCSIQTVGSEFGVKGMKEQIHPALYQQFV